MTWQKILEEAQQVALDYGPKVAGAVATLVIGWIGAKIVRAVVRKLARRLCRLAGLLFTRENMHELADDLFD